MLSLGLGLGSREEIRAGWPLLPSSGRSSPSGGSSREVGGAVGVAPRLSGRSSPGGGYSLGETSSALAGPGGITSVPRGVASSTPSSGAGVVGRFLLWLFFEAAKKRAH